MTLTQSAQNTLARGGTIVTANARAARHLQRVNQAHEAALGNSAWLSPHILSWEAWLEESWHTLIMQGYEDRLLLSPLATDEIWVRVLKEDGADARVLTVRGLAHTASEAWRMLCTYGDATDLHTVSGFADSRAFTTWAGRFMRLAEQNRWLDSARLPSVIAQAISNSHLHPPPAILFCGFDRVPPAVQRVVTALRDSGCDVEITGFASSSGSATVPVSTFVEAATPREELEAIAIWARDAIDTNPAVRINVVVPDVASMQDAIEQVFRRILAPETRGILAGETALPYEFSLGQPLAQYSMIRSALLLLQWAHSPISLDDISWLLNCEYCGEGDRWSRARADADLRKRGKSLRLEANMRWAVTAMDGSRSAWPRKLLDLERTAERLHLNRSADTATFTTWMEAVEKYLDAAEWPGERSLNSDEYQVQNRWQRLLLSVAHLDSSLPKLTFAEAFKILKRAVQSSSFAAESHDAPIQIVGAIESAGLTADAVWFAGADELAWPPSRRPNPLLPLHLQKSAAMPGADTAADFEFALGVTRRICASAPVVFASFTRHKNDAEPAASAVFSALPWTERICADTMPREQAEEAYLETESVLDLSHVAWKEDRTAGGAEVLRDQAACPFRAFASKRLQAKTLEEIEEGLDSRDRGTIVHKVLQDFWNEVRDHQHLDALTEQQSLEILQRNIDSALRGHSATDAWSAAFLAAESDRLKTLLAGWLAVERERTPFTVLQQEQVADTQIGPLKLRLRMDRVDQAAAGKLILDYKTGKASIRDWEGERPDQPQLPLYALSMKPLVGLGFACIAAKKTAISGLQREEGVFFAPGDDRGRKMTDPLDDRVERWREVLTILAEEFVSGEARVAPKKGLATCRNCGLETLCRIAEADLFIAGEVEE